MRYGCGMLAQGLIEDFERPRTIGIQQRAGDRGDKLKVLLGERCSKSLNLYKKKNKQNTYTPTNHLSAQCVKKKLSNETTGKKIP